MPSSTSSTAFNIFMDRKKRRSSSSTTDDLAIVKAAAWALFQRGSGSEGKLMMREFDVARTHHHQQTFKPSRYKLEAMKKIKECSTQEPSSPSPPSSSSSHRPSPVRTEDNSLLDAYNVERISKQLDYLLASSSKRFCSNSLITEILTNKTLVTVLFHHLQILVIVLVLLLLVVQ